MQFVILITLTERFAYIIEAICQAAARRASLRFCLGIGLPQLAGPFITIIAIRLRRYAARFIRLAATPQSSAPAPRPPRDRKRPSSPHTTPQGFGWLLRLVPETVGYASHLCQLLTDPELAALLATHPSLRRTLRPLCHMLGIRPNLIPPTPPATPSLTPAPSPSPDAPCGSITAEPPPPIPPPATPPTPMALGPPPLPA